MSGNAPEPALMTAPVDADTRLPIALSARAPMQTARMTAETLPHIRRRLQQKGITGEDLEDLCLEAQERFLAALHRREQREQDALEHPLRYALTVADTVFDDHLRQQRPNWCRLKRRVLYLLDNPRTKGLFARWKHRTAWIGGFARWNLHPFRPNARYHAFCQRRALFCQQELGDQNPEQMPLPALLAHLFRWIGTPLEIDELTSHVAEMQHITDARLLSLDELAQQNDSDSDHWLPPSTEDVCARVLDSIHGETFRAQLWQIICILPIRQRAALLLGMSPDELLLTDTMSAIAAALEMPLSALMELWTSLPLSDTQLAHRLDITPKQVSNLRKCARERIARNMKIQP